MVPVDRLPECAAHADIGQGIGNIISNLGSPFPGMSVSLPIPAAPPLLGVQLFGQSVWLDPVANAFGALVSNGLRTTIGNF